MFKHIALIALIILVVSCSVGPALDQPLSDTEAVEKAATEGIEVTFHGESCDVDAPSTLPIGEYHFTLNDQSQLTSSDLIVARITGGHTYQELLDLQPTPGEYYPKPDWLIYVKRIGSIDPSTGQRSYEVTLELGELAVYVYGLTQKAEEWLWFCMPILGVEVTN
jgi:hypothetical protein